MKQFLALVLLSGLLCTCLGDKDQKQLGIFNVVKFNNDACVAENSGKNGTCYTEEECEDRGGVAKGSCAEGYGVCCVFTMLCGGSKAENLTYFESNSQSTVGACNARICKSNSKVCQLRLDFVSFVIAGPSVDTTTSFKSITAASHGGVGAPAGNFYGQCLTDSFAVTSSGNRGTPVICGTNTGYHMYVDATSDCNTLSFHLADGAVSVTRQWEIRVTQYNCDSMNKAPEGCLQYFYGSNTGTLETFNKANNIHLANQNQLICIRREEGMCQICYSAATGDFTVSAGTTSKSALVGKSSQCCHIKTITSASGHPNYDCAIIPVPSKATGEVLSNANGQFCGVFLATASTTDESANAATICSKVTPFQIRFLSDGKEDENLGDEVTNNGNRGFKLHFEQKSC